jgi:hypothetical protein
MRRMHDVKCAKIVGVRTTHAEDFERQHIPEYFAAEVERKKKGSGRECGKERRGIKER